MKQLWGVKMEGLAEAGSSRPDHIVSTEIRFLIKSKPVRFNIVYEVGKCQGGKHSFGLNAVQHEHDVTTTLPADICSVGVRQVIDTTSNAQGKVLHPSVHIWNSALNKDARYGGGTRQVQTVSQRLQHATL
jgi:rhamnose utilization protein RhaD (predicted bifunctional aldolase and dehydrogenase)